MPEELPVSIAFLTAAQAELYHDGPFIVVVRTREEFSRWLLDPLPGAEGLQVESLIGDPDGWALAAQGKLPIPLDVILEDPAREFSALYRLADVRLVRSVRVTIPVKSGMMRALRLAASMQLPVRLLPGQPDEEALAELTAALSFYLRDPMVDAPVEPFHSLLATCCGHAAGTLWEFLEQDPAIYDHRDASGKALHPPDFVSAALARLLNTGAECAACRWQAICAGYFKWPDPAYGCSGVKQLLATLESAADDISRDLAESATGASLP